MSVIGTSPHDGCRLSEDRNWTEQVRTTRLTLMYGPAARCKRFRQPGRCGLASMYPASDWSVGAPGHHGYQRAFELISGQASNGPFGSPGFACAGKTDPPSSSHPLADLGGYSCMNRSCGSVQASPMVSLSRTSATKTSIGAIDC